MTGNTEKTSQKSNGWSTASQYLASRRKTALIALLKDLYDADARNRDLIHSRFPSGDESAAVLQAYRTRIKEELSLQPADSNRKADKAYKTIQKYSRTTGNAAGTVELLLTFVEGSLEFTDVSGEIDEWVFTHLEAAFHELVRQLLSPAKDYYPQISERLTKLEQRTEGIDWGFHVFVVGHVSLIKTKLANG